MDDVVFLIVVEYGHQQFDNDLLNRESGARRIRGYWIPEDVKSTEDTAQ